VKETKEKASCDGEVIQIWSTWPTFGLRRLRRLATCRFAFKKGPSDFESVVGWVKNGQRMEVFFGWLAACIFEGLTPKSC
jgi:hypothetical protein